MIAQSDEAGLITHAAKQVQVQVRELPHCRFMEIFLFRLGLPLHRESGVVFKYTLAGFDGSQNLHHNSPEMADHDPVISSQVVIII